MITPARLPVIVKRLDHQYGRQQWSPRYAPVDELVFTILTQNTTDITAERALNSLKAALPTWEQVAAAGVAEIAGAIHCCGLAPTKAAYIKEALSGIVAEQGDLSFKFLDGMSNKEAVAYLTKFRGIGVKTASCVLMFSLGRPVFPVDTHVFRIMKRLDFIDPAITSRETGHQIINAITLPGDVFTLHVNLVTHGRRVCKALRPLCDRCIIEPLCPASTSLQPAVPFR